MSDAAQPVDAEVRSSWKEVLIADRWRILTVGLLGTGIAVLIGVDLSIPRWTKLFVLTFLVAAGLAYMPATKIVRWLYRPGYTYLVELDAADADVALWALPPATWREIDVDEGELFPLQAAVPAWECREYDPEVNVAIGTWRGSASDLELIQERSRIREIRGALEDLAKEGLGYRVMQSGIVRAAVRNVVLSFVEAFERDAVYEGDEIRRAIDRTLDDWSFEDDTDPEAGVADDGSLAAENVEAEPSTPPDEPEGTHDV